MHRCNIFFIFHVYYGIFIMIKSVRKYDEQMLTITTNTQQMENCGLELQLHIYEKKKT